MTLLRQIHRLSRLELRLVFSQTPWLVTVCVVSLIPALYLLIYLSSMWDPASHTRSLRVGLVNQDKGYSYRDQMVEIGGELVNRLIRKADLVIFPWSVLMSPASVSDPVIWPLPSSSRRIFLRWPCLLEWPMRGALKFMLQRGTTTKPI